MAVLVLGATGFLGKRVVKKLDTAKVNYAPASLSLGTDFRDHKQFEKIFLENPEIDKIINCAAFVGGIKFGLEHTGEIFYNNTLMSAHMFELARKYNIKHIVNPISNCAYPAKLTENFREEQFWDGPLHESVLTYGFVRKGSWVQSWAYKKQYGLDTINLILPNMYGPGDHFDETRSHALGALIMKFVEAKKDKQSKVVVWGSGKPIREWLYVDDGAEILVRSLDVKPFSDPINVGVGKGISILDLANLIKEIVGYKGEILFDKSKPDGAPHKTMDNTKLKKIFKWEPSTDLREGIETTVDWYTKNKIRS